jgi:tetratricopeptide (TPR) repeat protein
LAKGDYQGAVKILKSSSKLECIHDPFALSAYAKSLSLICKFEESNRILNKALQEESDPFLLTTEGDNYKGLKDYLNAEKCYTQAMFMIPNRLYPRYLLVKLYLVKGDTSKAITEADQLLNMKEKASSMDTWYMKEEMKDVLKLSKRIQ